MKLLDLNLVLYAYDEASPRHEAARSWMSRTLSGGETVGLPWAVALGFVRLSTKSQVFADPLPVDEAFAVVDGILAAPAATLVQETPRHLALVRRLLEPLGTAGNLTTDAHLAALSIEHGATMCSCDSDFSRFPGVRWLDPLRT